MEFFQRSYNNSRAGSRTPSRSGSRITSRNQSRSRHPQDDDDDDFGVPSIDLFFAPAVDADHEQPEPKSLEILNSDRAKSSIEVREDAMKRLILAVSRRFEPVTEQAFQVCCKALHEAKGDQETVLALKLLAVVVGTDTDLVTDIPDQILNRVWSMAASDSYPHPVRANLVFGYSILLYFLKSGSGGFNLEQLVDRYFDLASATTENDVAASAYYAAGLLVATAPERGRNALLETVAESVVSTLSSAGQQHEIVLSLSELLAQCYQLWDYAENSRGPLPEGPQDVVAELEAYIGEHSKIHAKKDKRTTKSIVRDVIRSIENYSDPERRESLTYDDMIISHISFVPIVDKRSRKSLAIESWSKLFLVKHLKWLYGGDIYTQIVSNPHIQDMFLSTNEKGAPDLREELEREKSALEEPATSAGVDAVRETNARKRDQQIDRERREKMVMNGQAVA